MNTDTNTIVPEISNPNNLYAKYARATFEEMKGKIFLSNRYNPSMDVTTTETIIYMKNLPDPVKGIGANTGTITIAGGKLIIRNALDVKLFLEIAKAVPGYFREYNPLIEIEERKNKEYEELVKRIEAMDMPESKRDILLKQLSREAEKQGAEVVEVIEPSVTEAPATAEVPATTEAPAEVVELTVASPLVGVPTKMPVEAKPEVSVSGVSVSGVSKQATKRSAK